MSKKPVVTRWNYSDTWCILGDDFLGRDGNFHINTDESCRWETQQEAEIFLKNWEIKQLQKELDELTTVKHGDVFTVDAVDRRFLLVQCSVDSTQFSCYDNQGGGALYCADEIKEYYKDGRWIKVGNIFQGYVWK